MLWKRNSAQNAAVGKAWIDRIFRKRLFHKNEFSTAVNNFVENDTHLTRLVGIESVWCAVHFTAMRMHFTFQKTHLAKNLLLFFQKWCIIYAQKQRSHRRLSDTVKIKLETVSDMGETEVVIRCRELDEETERLLSTIRLFANTIIGKNDNKTFILKPEDICYFDTQDNKVMLITEESVYETPLKMYEIEEKFKNTGFLRVSRYSIINLRKVSYLEPLFNGRMVAVMKNGDKVVITRLYIQALKNALGM